MSEIMDIRIHHQLAQEYYRQQMFQRLPDPYPTMLPVPPPPRTFPAGIPPRFTLPGVEVKLQNSDLWSEFHKIGTEMIITKSGRRMFPSMRLSLSGLENDQNYCILLEMVPIADCRYKFSGSQWVPAGGAEPQSPQNIYIHPDSPALGSHWQAQPILFNKVKLTNNTLDSNGHVVLTSMHKYQPRIHIIRTSDPAQIPWSPQTSFAFNETEFVAVTAYQNDRITKLKIDNNPFAKGFRETGQSRCKRKAGSSGSNQTENNGSSNSENDCKMKVIKDEEDSFIEGHASKRIRSDDSVCSVGSLDDSGLSVCETSSSGTSSPTTTNERLLPSTSSISPSASVTSSSPYLTHSYPALHHPNPNELILQRCQNMFGPSSFNYQWMDLVNMMHRQQQYFPELQMIPPYFSPTNTITSNSNHSPNPASSHREEDEASTSSSPSPNKSVDLSVNPVKKKSNFSILSILGHN